jgi:hypothetical protein
MSVAVKLVPVVISAEVIETTDTGCRFFTIETAPISNDPATWTHKTTVCPEAAGKGVFYKRTVGLEPGPNTINIAVFNFGMWKFRITVKVASTGQIIATIDDVHWVTPSLVNSYTINVPDVPVLEIEDTGDTDPSAIIRRMMEKMLPPMIQMMGMMMMVQMMAGMMSSMAVAFRGGF